MKENQHHQHHVPHGLNNSGGSSKIPRPPDHPKNPDGNSSVICGPADTSSQSNNSGNNNHPVSNSHDGVRRFSRTIYTHQSQNSNNIISSVANNASNNNISNTTCSNNNNNNNNAIFKIPKIEDSAEHPMENRKFNAQNRMMREIHHHHHHHHHDATTGTRRESTSTVSDHASVIPWRSSADGGFPTARNSSDLSIHRQDHQSRSRRASTEEMVCDSSTSPTRRMIKTIFDTKVPPSGKNSADKLGDYSRHLPHLTPAEYLANFSRRGTAENGETALPPATPASLRSTVLDYPSRNSGSFSSPRHSAVRGKKRMLSVSPLSADFLDLSGIIRTSPNSLVAYVINNEAQLGFASRGSGRNSSAASLGSRGSYGHLSAAVSPSLQAFTRAKNHFAQHSTTPQSLNLNLKVEEDLSVPSSAPVQQSCVVGSTTSGLVPHPPPSLPPPTSSLPHPPSVAGAIPCGSAVQEQYDAVASADPCLNSPASITTVDSNEARSCLVDGESADDEEVEEQLEDYQCMWKGCNLTLEGQKEMVQHVNTEHIQKNKKDCTCYWDGCTRDEKPFKAMYMLVVHVRRHTGEKPHECHYEGCNKAYSRLENLKTHLRSHTGERPYVCEVAGCQKAFSNASDRAKHQNRTHSTVKQYACKVPGCPKRYTDPSSLRKHMKTVHGAINQPTKKLKGDGGAKKAEILPSAAENEATSTTTTTTAGATKREENDNSRNTTAATTTTTASAAPTSNNSNNHSSNNNNYNSNNKSKQDSKCKPSKKLQHLPATKNQKQPAPSYGALPAGVVCAPLPSQERAVYGVDTPDQLNGTGTIISMHKNSWNSENINPSNSSNGIDRNFLDNNNNNSVLYNSNVPNVNMGQQDVHVQMPPPPLPHNFPQIGKTIEQPSLMEYNEKRFLGNQTMKPPRPGGPRRGSNASTGSTDSNYASGIDTYNGSRRGSDVSIGSRKSVPAASPLPSRTFSPGRIRQTVPEGEVVENYKDQLSPPNMSLIMDNSPPDQFMRGEGGAGMNDGYFNQLSRMSSGYGSRQNVYFAAKHSARNSPLNMNRHEIRRASEGALKQGGNDCVGFYGGSSHPPQASPLRRGSEPANITDIIDNTPRRHSLSGFKPLPLPQSMQQSITPDIPNADIPAPDIDSKQKSHFQMPCTCVATTTTSLKYGVVNSGDDKMMVERNLPQQWGMNVQQQQQQHPTSHSGQQYPHYATHVTTNNMDYANMQGTFPLQPKSLPNMTIYPDSTENIHGSHANERGNDRNLYTEFEKYHMQQKKGGFTDHGMDHGGHGAPNQMFNNSDAMMDASFPQNFNLFNQLHMTTENNANHQMVNHNQVYPHTDMMNGQPGGYINQQHASSLEENLFIYPQNVQNSELPCSNNEKPHGFNSTLQWRNDHFGAKQITEADSTDDKNLESIIIRDLGALTTSEACDGALDPRAPSNMTVTNMAVSNMDALLTSFVEENKYFENQAFDKYP